MYVKSIYLDDLKRQYEKLFKEQIRFDDETGIYHLDKCCLQIKSWNNKLELEKRIGSNEIIENIMRLMEVMKYYNFLEIDNCEESEGIKNEQD